MPDHSNRGKKIKYLIWIDWVCPDPSAEPFFPPADPQSRPAECYLQILLLQECLCREETSRGPNSLLSIQVPWVALEQSDDSPECWSLQGAQVLGQHLPRRDEGQSLPNSGVHCRSLPGLLLVACSLFPISPSFFLFSVSLTCYDWFFFPA